MIADSLLESLDLLNSGIELFNTKCISTLKADSEACKRHLYASSAFGTAYIGKLGYDKVSHIIKENSPETAKELLDQLIQHINDKTIVKESHE